MTTANSRPSRIWLAWAGATLTLAAFTACPAGAETPREIAGAACRVNVLTATPEQLAHLHRVGPVLAARIVEWREARETPATMLHELTEVQGVGGLTVCMNQLWIHLGGDGLAGSVTTTCDSKQRPPAALIEACRAATSPADYCWTC